MQRHKPPERKRHDQAYSQQQAHSELHAMTLPLTILGFIAASQAAVIAYLCYLLTRQHDRTEARILASDRTLSDLQRPHEGTHPSRTGHPRGREAPQV